MSITDVPEEVTVLIIYYLPLLDVIAYQQVCKTWYRTVERYYTKIILKNQLSTALFHYVKRFPHTKEIYYKGDSDLGDNFLRSNHLPKLRYVFANDYPVVLFAFNFKDWRKRIHKLRPQYSIIPVAYDEAYVEYEDDEQKIEKTLRTSLITHVVVQKSDEFTPEPFIQVMKHATLTITHLYTFSTVDVIQCLEKAATQYPKLTHLLVINPNYNLDRILKLTPNLTCFSTKQLSAECARTLVKTCALETIQVTNLEDQETIKILTSCSKMLKSLTVRSFFQLEHDLELEELHVHTFDWGILKHLQQLKRLHVTNIELHEKMIQSLMHCKQLEEITIDDAKDIEKYCQGVQDVLFYKCKRRFIQGGDTLWTRNQ
jgi:hypothetical protein